MSKQDPPTALEIIAVLHAKEFPPEVDVLISVKPKSSLVAVYLATRVCTRILEIEPKDASAAGWQSELNADVDQAVSDLIGRTAEIAFKPPQEPQILADAGAAFEQALSRMKS